MRGGFWYKSGMKERIRAVIIFAGLAGVMLAGVVFRGADCGCPVLHAAGHSPAAGEGVEITYHKMERYLPALEMPAEHMLPDVSNFDQISGIMARAPQLAVPPSFMPEERPAVQGSAFSFTELDEDAGIQTPGWGWLADEAGLLSYDINVPDAQDPFESMLRRQLFPDIDILDQTDPWSSMLDMRMPDGADLIRTPAQPSAGPVEFDL